MERKHLSLNNSALWETPKTSFSININTQEPVGYMINNSQDEVAGEGVGTLSFEKVIMLALHHIGEFHR